MPEEGRPERGPDLGGRLDGLSCCSSRIDRILGEVGQHFVRVLLLDQRLLDQPLGFREAELFGPGEKGAVAGDLVMLDGLSGRDQTGVKSLFLRPTVG